MTARKVLGYTRVSTAEQVDGFGLDVQRGAIERYCKDHGLRLVRVFSDEGQSGSNGLDTRVELAEALALVERGEVAGLVVYRLDRLARDLLLQETLMARMRQAGAEVLSVSEPDIDSDDATRVLVRQVLGSISQYERAVIRGRMMAGKAAKVARGGYGGGRPPYGYRAAGGELVPDEGEQAIIARARTLAAGGRSLREIAAVLEDSGVRPRTVGARWHPRTVRALLTTQAHAPSLTP
ncbi:MAG TPA: recombinase family protein [Acidothermaceae bacterium]|nr:recombinase family protein [Acidothermaceae bacterium]